MKPSHHKQAEGEAIQSQASRGRKVLTTSNVGGGGEGESIGGWKLIRRVEKGEPALRVGSGEWARWPGLFSRRSRATWSTPSCRLPWAMDMLRILIASSSTWRWTAVRRDRTQCCFVATEPALRCIRWSEVNIPNLHGSPSKNSTI